MSITEASDISRILNLAQLVQQHPFLRRNRILHQVANRIGDAGIGAAPAQPLNEMEELAHLQGLAVDTIEQAIIWSREAMWFRNQSLDGVPIPDDLTPFETELHAFFRMPRSGSWCWVREFGAARRALEEGIREMNERDQRPAPIQVVHPVEPTQNLNGQETPRVGNAAQNPSVVAAHGEQVEEEPILERRQNIGIESASMEPMNALDAQDAQGSPTSVANTGVARPTALLPQVPSPGATPAVNDTAPEQVAQSAGTPTGPENQIRAPFLDRPLALVVPLAPRPATQQEEDRKRRFKKRETLKRAADAVNSAAPRLLTGTPEHQAALKRARDCNQKVQSDEKLRILLPEIVFGTLFNTSRTTEAVPQPKDIAAPTAVSLFWTWNKKVNKIPRDVSCDMWKEWQRTQHASYWEWMNRAELLDQIILEQLQLGLITGRLPSEGQVVGARPAGDGVAAPQRQASRPPTAGRVVNGGSRRDGSRRDGSRLDDALSQTPNAARSSHRVAGLVKNGTQRPGRDERLRASSVGAGLRGSSQRDRSRSDVAIRRADGSKRPGRGGLQSNPPRRRSIDARRDLDQRSRRDGSRSNEVRPSRPSRVTSATRMAPPRRDRESSENEAPRVPTRRSSSTGRSLRDTPARRLQSPRVLRSSSRLRSKSRQDQDNDSQSPVAKRTRRSPTRPDNGAGRAVSQTRTRSHSRPAQQPTPHRPCTQSQSHGRERDPEDPVDVRAQVQRRIELLRNRNSSRSGPATPAQGQNASPRPTRSILRRSSPSSSTRPTVRFNLSHQTSDESHFRLTRQQERMLADGEARMARQQNTDEARTTRSQGAGPSESGDGKWSNGSRK